MKWLLLLFVFLSGCVSQPTGLKAGDCFITTLDGTKLVFRVIEVGKYVYRATDTQGRLYRTFSKDPVEYAKTDCFESFNNVKSGNKE